MAEAISFRRGTTQENESFIGCEGEIVVDLGSEDQSYNQQNNFFHGKTINKAPTLRVHLGLEGQAGGVVMARADMANVNTELLAETPDDIKYGHTGKNLAYADLSNMEFTEAGKIRAREILNEYGIGYKDGTNIDTTDFTKTTDDRKSTGPILMKNDFSNITNWSIADNRFLQQDLSDLDTAILAVGEPGAHIGKNLVYRDFSNINTSILAETENETDPAYTEDESNRHTGKDLAYRDLSNLDDTILKTKIDGLSDQGIYLDAYQLNQNICNNILTDPNNPSKYPSNNAVFTYVEDKFDNLPFAKADLSNVTQTGWDIASSNESLFGVKTIINSGGSGYAPGDMIGTPLCYADHYLNVIVDATNALQSITYCHTDIDGVYFNTDARVDYEIIEQTAGTTLNNLQFTRSQFDAKLGSDERSRRTTKTYSIVYDGTNWILDGSTTISDITTYGISFDGTPVNGDTFTVRYTKYDSVTTDISYNDPVGGASFTFTKERVTSGGLMRSDLSNALVMSHNYSGASITYRTNETEPTEGDIKEYDSPTMYIQKYSNNYQGVVQNTVYLANYTDINGSAHNNEESLVNFSAIINSSGRNVNGLYITEYGTYSKTNNDTENFTSSELVATKGYCDQKQNLQNVKPINSGTTVTLDNTNAIYCLSVNGDATITINTSGVNLQNNTAKTFELYLTVGATIPSISWNGITSWLSDSERAPVNPNSTSIFTLRLQKINNVTKVIANFGGDFLNED